MKKNKKKLLVKIFGMIFLVLIVLYFLLLIICRNTDYNLVKKSENEEGMAYLSVVVPLKVHFKKVCVFPNPSYTNRYEVKFKNGLVIPVKLALELWLVNLDDLQEKGFPCR